jgi:hypothetical protein
MKRLLARHMFPWLSQKCAGKRFCIRCLEATETENISLVKLTPMVLEMGHYDLPNRVNYDAVCHAMGVRVTRGHPILHIIQGRMNACQHCVPIRIKRKGQENKPRSPCKLG